MRPAHQRYPQPSFVFPLTPPGPGGLDATEQEAPSKGFEASELHGSTWTPTPEPSPLLSRLQYFPEKQIPERPTRHRRAVSDSTIQEPTPASESDQGAFKIVISKPGDEQRPKTMEDVDPAATPVLDIRIPSWRLGTPHFTSRGPMLRGSSYAPTEEYRNSGLSLLNRSHQELGTPIRGLASRRPSALQVPPLRSNASHSLKSPSLKSPSSASPLTARPTRATYASTHLTIEPAMFDGLTFRPTCDDRSIVRYASISGAVTAATPPRLVAEITSPSFLDYELISDFFLTFRSFLEPHDLLRMLVARLRWAVAREDETGMVVRVRTFVALRHWILNYFMDDFVLDYTLRVTFCSLLNDFVDELYQDTRARKVQLKILTELKKCWRRVCAHYWDGPDFDDTLSASVPISPGGIAGHRDPKLDPSFWDKEEEEDEVPQLQSIFPQRILATGPNSFYADVSRAGHVGDSIVYENRPRTPENQVANAADPDLGPGSPYSMTSMDVVSCSFPGKAIRSLNPLGGHPLALHPAPSSSVYTQTGPVATTPRALVGKRVRPKQQHQRNNSLTDSLRDHDPDKVSIRDREFTMTSPNAGSLVRGNVFPPAKGFVDFPPAPPRQGEAHRQTTIFEPQENSRLQLVKQPDAMSSNGMRKLIGSVRRALSNRGAGMGSSNNNLIAMEAIGPKGATTNRLPGTAIVPTQQASQQGARPPVRIDLLGAEVAEDFKKAVREDAAAEAEQFGLGIAPAPNSAPLPGRDYSTAHLEDSEFHLLQKDKARPVSDMGMTVGSKSIVIFDDTVPFKSSMVRGILPTVNSSVEEFGQNVVPQGGDPTPPNTPPEGDDGGVPRRSSSFLNRHAIRPSFDDDPSLPPFVPDLATLGRDSTAVRPSQDEPRPSLSSPRENRRPPLSGTHWRHRRNKSTKTQRSLNSIMHERRASFSSGLIPPSMIQSLDATTYSEGSLADKDLESAVPEPLRVLRRRPGGDLKKATNVGELDHVALRRSRSVGSLTTYSDSMRSFMRSPQADSERSRGPPTSDFVPGRSEAFSVGQLADKGKRDLSLFSTHSSKPVMRPSFEAEAQRLAQIPDDDDDGGIESALAKLEGKFERRPPRLSLEAAAPVVDAEAIGVAIGDPEQVEQEKRDHRHRHIDEGALVPEAPEVPEHNLEESPDFFEADSSYLEVPQRPRTGQQSFLSEGSQESYSSIPLLERGLNDDVPVRGSDKAWTDKSVFVGSDDEASIVETEKGLSTIDNSDHQHMSFDFIQKTDSLENIKSGEEAQSQTEGDRSFLADESADDTDLSSELSADEFDAQEEEANPYTPRARLPVHPLGEPSHAIKDKVPTPPSASAPFATPSPVTNQAVPELHVEQLWQQNPVKVSLDRDPTAPYLRAGANSSDPTGTSEALRGAPAMPGGDMARKYSVHLPFILAFESEVLAQQFTLIEKDALNEIDWKDLIEMNWKNGSCGDYRSWVDFLRNTDARGVEVVVARFNIMVKWAISEVVLTQDIEERARCIIKYIHIASHCRRYRNFATLAQLTIALCSNEVARLPRTWALVPARDLNTLRDLETLVTPTRNFYNLRAEMEAGSDMGCIPFVGIYTHDLLFNAQRPSEIASSPTTPPLVNFERYRIGAAVVKTLLRLLEASTRYEFQPIEGITERCLWMGALSDDDIRRHSDSLE